MTKETTPPEAEEFIEAAWQNETDLINELAAKHPYLVDRANPYLLDALHTACNSCQFEAAKLLVEKYKADVNAILDKERGMTALGEAWNSHDMRIVKMLIKNGANAEEVCGILNEQEGEINRLKLAKPSCPGSQCGPP